MSVSTYVHVHMHTHVRAHTHTHKFVYTHIRMQVWNYICLPLASQINISNQGLEIKPYIHQRCSEGSNLVLSHRDPETPQRLRQNCVLLSPAKVQVSSGLLQWQGLWVQ